VGQFQEGAEEVLMEAGPGSDLHEVIAAGEGATEAQDEDVLQAMLEVAALAPGIRQGLQLREQGTGLLGQGESSLSGVSSMSAIVVRP
jgi:hypothetical protein